MARNMVSIKVPQETEADLQLAMKIAPVRFTSNAEIFRAALRNHVLRLRALNILSPEHCQGIE